MLTTEVANSIGFWFHCIDVRSVLPDRWQSEIVEAASKLAVAKTIVPTSVTSREAATDLRLPVLTVGGGKIRDHLPWLDQLYRGPFRDLAQLLCSEPISCAQNIRYGANLNIQRGPSMRYECHVDSNPIEGLLYVTTHPPGSGGELVVARRKEVTGVDQVAEDSIRVFPQAGMLYFFDARKHSHYVEPLVGQQAVRVVMAMNYYTPSCSEADRPADLDAHLGLA